MGEAMSDDNLPATLKTGGPNGFDQELLPEVPGLDLVPDLNEDDVLSLTRRIRVRQLAIDLNKNGGRLSDDPEERKIQLSLMKDLDSQATKVKMIGAKERIGAADREAALAVAKMLKLVGENPMRRDPIEGEVTRPRPSIKDAGELSPLKLVPDETQVGLDHTTYEELMERNSDAE